MKFAVLKARSWRVVKNKVHNLMVNERNKKNSNITIYLLIFVFYIVNIFFYVFYIIIVILEHRQSFFRSIQEIMIVTVDSYRHVKIAFD